MIEKGKEETYAKRDERASVFAADPSTQNQYSLHAIVLNEIVIYILLML